MKLKEIKDYSVGEKVRILVDGQRVRGVVCERCEEACSPSPIVRLKVKWRDDQLAKTIERTNAGDIVPDGYLFVGEDVQILHVRAWHSGHRLKAQSDSGWYTISPSGEVCWYPNSDIRLPPTEQDRIADATAAKDKIIAEQSAKIADLEKRLAAVVAMRDSAERRLAKVLALITGETS